MNHFFSTIHFITRTPWKENCWIFEIICSWFDRKIDFYYVYLYFIIIVHHLSWSYQRFLRGIIVFFSVETLSLPFFFTLNYLPFYFVFVFLLIFSSFYLLLSSKSFFNANIFYKHIDFFCPTLFLYFHFFVIRLTLIFDRILLIVFIYILNW